MLINNEAFQKIIRKHPNLCALGLFDGETCGQVGADFKAERQRLEDAFDAFALCCDWLLDCTPLKHVSCVAPESTTLCRLVEERFSVGIIPGALIAAALHLRFPTQPIIDTPNIKIGISSRSPTLPQA